MWNGESHMVRSTLLHFAYLAGPSGEKWSFYISRHICNFNKGIVQSFIVEIENDNLSFQLIIWRSNSSLLDASSNGVTAFFSCMGLPQPAMQVVYLLATCHFWSRHPSWRRVLRTPPQLLLLKAECHKYEAEIKPESEAESQDYELENSR